MEARITKTIKTINLLTVILWLIVVGTFGISAYIGGGDTVGTNIFTFVCAIFLLVNNWSFKKLLKKNDPEPKKVIRLASYALIAIYITLFLGCLTDPRTPFIFLLVLLPYHFIRSSWKKAEKPEAR